MDPDELGAMYILRKVLSDMNQVEAMELLISRMARTKTNAGVLDEHETWGERRDFSHGMNIDEHR